MLSVADNKNRYNNQLVSLKTKGGKAFLSSTFIYEATNGVSSTFYFESIRGNSRERLLDLLDILDILGTFLVMSQMGHN